MNLTNVYCTVFVVISTTAKTTTLTANTLAANSGNTDLLLYPTPDPKHKYFLPRKKSLNWPFIHRVNMSFNSFNSLCTMRDCNCFVISYLCGFKN